MLKNNQPLRIIGIDPGYDRLGWAVATIENKQFKLNDYACIQTDKKTDLFLRYVQLQQDLQKTIDYYHPQIAVIESLFFTNNQKTALKVSESRGIIIATFISNKLTICEYTPLQIKQAVTGYGRADKLAINKMLRTELKLEDKKIIDDAMDAIGVSYTYFLRQGA